MPYSEKIEKPKSLGNLKRPLTKGGEALLPMVISVSWKVWSNSNRSIEYHDVISEALLGLIKASKKYNKNLKVKLSTWVYSRVLGAAKDAVRNQKTYDQRFVLTDPVLMEISSEDDGVFSRLSRKELLRQLNVVMERELTTEDSQVLVLFYIKEMSEDAIAKMLKCSKRVVTSARKSALVNARLALNRRGLHGF